MLRTVLIAVSLLAMVAGSAVHAQRGERLRAWLQQHRQEAQGSASFAPPAPSQMQTASYGEDPLQKLEYWPAAPGSVLAGRKPPLVVFVHGGAWEFGDMDNATGKWKPAHYPGEGYALASIDYRMVPQVKVADEAADIAQALRWLVDHAGELGFDRHRIVIMGHSAGAHLVALVGTDEIYLHLVGLSFADLVGVIPIDGAAYDVPAQLRDGPPIMQPIYRQVFGDDPASQRALSPTLQAAAPNAPAFLLLHVQRPDGIAQAKELEAALKAAGTPVERQDFPGEGLRGHGQINRSLGDPDYPATAVVDAWLADRFGERPRP